MSEDAAHPTRDQGEPTWLAEVLSDARRQKWCVRIGCTTCGCGEFLKGVAEGAAQAAGRPSSKQNWYPAQFLSGLDSEDLIIPFQSALHGLSETECRLYAEPLGLLAFLLVDADSEGVQLTNFGVSAFQDVIDQTRIRLIRKRARRLEASVRAELGRAQKALRKLQRAEAHRIRLIEKADRDATWRAHAAASGQRLETEDEVTDRRAARKRRREVHRQR